MKVSNVYTNIKNKKSQPQTHPHIMIKSNSRLEKSKKKHKEICANWVAIAVADHLIQTPAAFLLHESI